MRYALFFLAFLGASGLAGNAVWSEATKPSLDELIKQFQSDAPKVKAEVDIEAWVESGDGAGQPDEMVITLLPGGKTKLNADPGITITPTAQTGVDWQITLPHRHQDLSITYFEPPAEIRMPFSAEASEPIEILVEYAYCLVDYQCFFGEETLSVVQASPASSG